MSDAAKARFVTVAMFILRADKSKLTGPPPSTIADYKARTSGAG